MGAQDNLRPPTAYYADLVDRCWIIYYCDDHMSRSRSNILEKKICVGKPFRFFLVQNFVAFPSKYYSNIYLFFVWKNERTMFLYKILYFCIRHDVFLSESNAKIWEKSETINLRTYPTH